MHTVLGTTTQQQVAFVGPLGVGKTTAVRTLSDVRVVTTEVMRAAMGMATRDPGGKTTTTVGIDYGEWRAPDGARVGVYGTPGQIRFASTRTAALARRTKIVLWVYGDRADAVEQCSHWLERLGDESLWRRTLVAVTRRDEVPRAPGLAEYEAGLARFGGGVPVVQADPRCRDDVVDAVTAALRLDPEEGR